MKTTQLFTNGGSQAVHLPKDCRFESTKVYVKKYEGMVILIPKDDPWSSFFQSLENFTEDFMSERQQPSQQARNDL